MNYKYIGKPKIFDPEYAALRIALAIAAIVLLLAACGGGGSSPTALAPEIDMRQPATIVPFSETGRQPGDTDLRLAFDLVGQDYFRCAGGHAGVMTRASLEQIPSAQYRGVGLALGPFANTTWTTRAMPDLVPVAVVETWGVGAVPANFNSLLVQTVSPELFDWVRYSFEVHSRQTPGQNFIGYTIKDGDKTVVDTGDVPDANPAVDMNRQAIAFFNAAVPGAATCPYTLRVINPTASWSAPDAGLPDLTAQPWSPQ